MPVVSEAQRRAMYAAAAGHSNIGIPKSVGAEFVASSHAGHLPEHVHRVTGGGIGHAALGDTLGRLATPHAVHFPAMHAGIGAGGGGAGGGGGMRHSQAMSPSQGTPWWTRSEARQEGQTGHTGFAEGGGIGHYDAGGMSMSTESPWWERSDARQMTADIPHGGGLINSGIAGRTDRLPLAVAADSHVIPADVVSGLGQGNTMNGARILNAAIKTAPFGVALPHGGRGHGPPAPPHPLPGYGASAGIDANPESGAYAHGGGIGEPSPDIAHGRAGIGHNSQSGHGHSQILAAGGEYIVEPHDVRHAGDGDINKGHEVLDRMIKNVREHVIKFLKTAPKPVK